MSDASRIGLVGAGTFVLVAALVPACRWVALRSGLTDQPSSERWHSSPTPCLGGLAIAAGALAWTFALPGWRREAATIALAACAVAVTGLVDDIRTVTPRVRLLVEAAAALVAASAGARVELFGGPIDIAITVVWLVVITNAFNLLDNMDGAVGSIGTTVAIALALCALFERQVLVGGLAVVVAAACLAFLLYNWHPARIFMGDAGALFIGFVLAVISLKLRTGVPHSASAVALALLVGPAVFDTSLVVISRTRARRPIFTGGTDHTSHRLMRLGLTPRATTVVLICGSAVSCTVGVAVAEGVVSPAVAAAGLGAPALLALLALLRVPVYADAGGTTTMVHDATPAAADVASSAPEREAGSAPEREAGSAPEREAGSAPEREAGSAPEREAGSAPEREAGSAPEPTDGSGPGRTTSTPPDLERFLDSLGRLVRDSAASRMAAPGRATGTDGPVLLDVEATPAADKVEEPPLPGMPVPLSGAVARPCEEVRPERIAELERELDRWRERAVIWRERALAADAFTTSLQAHIHDLRSHLDDVRAALHARIRPRLKSPGRHRELQDTAAPKRRTMLQRLVKSS